MMDYKFPHQLFPSHFNSGPPDTVFSHNVGGWGSYGQVLGVNIASNQGASERTFFSKHKTEGETWLPTEPLPAPLLPPKTAWQQSLTPSDPLDFPEQMQNFYLDNYQDAFSSMSRVLGEHFHFGERRSRKKYYDNAVHMWRTKGFMDKLKYKKCEDTHMNKSVRSYSGLLHDVIHDIPPELLAGLLYEELAEQRDQLQFSERATGGALAYIPFTQGSASSQQGYLLYPGKEGLDYLNFHRVVLVCLEGNPPCIDARSSQPFRFKLSGPVRQISSVSLLGESCVGVRSDHLCGVWRVSERIQPRLLQVIQTKEPATCISVSPHVLGEVLVASESGAAYLWTVGKSLQKFREEDSNLYFNARSLWRWCEFSAHPRMMVYADRTGVELTDLRTKASHSHTLFRIGKTPECRSGERVIFTRYLGDAHSFHHLITTQHSAYILDERFPCIPMLKWDHMMQCPPMFGFVLPGSSCSLDGGASTTKVLLGSQRSQEITLLQYSGGRAETCCSFGPPQALLKPRDSLQHLPVVIPHRLDAANTRLAQPAAGLACIQRRGGEECLCILQLTEAGDIFYQMLRPQQSDTSTSRPTTAQEEMPPSQQGVEESGLLPPPQQQLTLREMTPPRQKPIMLEGLLALNQRPSQETITGSQQLSLISDTDGEEDIIGPTQNFQGLIAETPERVLESHGAKKTGRRQRLSNMSVTSSEDSEFEGHHHHHNGSGLEVVVNDEPELDQMGLLDTEINNINDMEEADVICQSVEVNVGPADRLSTAKLSNKTLVMWRKWLQKLNKMSRKNGARQHLPHGTIKTKHLLNLPGNNNREGDPMEKDRLQSLRRDLRECMKAGSLLVHSATYLRALEMVLVPNPVEPRAWSDELSQRLTVSWQGEGEAGWKGWWEERLGMNRAEKVEVLRRKRRREKQARRANRNLELSGSFTSSVSYQSVLDDFSGGWSSATSQTAWSDVDGEGVLSRLDVWSEPGTPRATTPITTPTATPTATPQKQQGHQQDHPTPSTSHSLSQTNRSDSSSLAILKTPTQQKSKRPSEDYLISLFGSQEEPSQPQRYILEDGSTVNYDPYVVPSSQRPSSLSASQRTLRVDLSQASLPRVGLSQSLSQSSQSRMGLSQPKRKKSRMGF